MPRFQGGKRAADILWSNDQAVAELRALAMTYLALFAASETSKDPRPQLQKFYDKLQKHLEKLGREELDNGEYKSEAYGTFRHFLLFQSVPREGRLLDAIASMIFKEFTAHPQARHLLATRGAKALRDSFEKDKAFGEVPGDAPIIAVSRECYARAATYLTGHPIVQEKERDGLAANYYCYRYSTYVGHVAKSLITVLPPSDADPVCRFENKFRQRDKNVKLSNGIAYKDGDWIYFVGKIGNDGSALKVIAMEATGENRPGIKPALLLSKALKPIISRAALVAVHGKPDDVEIRVGDERTDPEFSGAAFDAAIRPLIRNYVKFSLTDSILFVDENKKELKLTQKQMVAEVERNFRERLFLQRSGSEPRPFNPADHEHYPFNQAINIDVD